MERNRSGMQNKPGFLNPVGRQLRNDCNFVGLVVLSLLVGMTFIGQLLRTALQWAGLLSEATVFDNTEFLLFYGLVYALSMGLPPVLIAVCCGRRSTPFSPSKPCGFGLGAGSVVACVGGCMAANMVNSYILSFLSRWGVTIPDPPKMIESTPISFLLGLLVMAVLPALLEEMVFRGYILQTVRPYGEWFAILISALLFSLIHGNIRQIPFAFIVGIFLGWLYVATDNIWLPIAVHFTNNAISTVLEYVGFYVEEQVQNYLTGGVVFGLSGVGIVTFILLSVSHTGLFWHRRGPAAEVLGQRWRAILLAPLFLLAVFVLLLIMIMEM